MEEIYNFLKEINSEESDFAATSEESELKQEKSKSNENLMNNECEIDSQSRHKILDLKKKFISNFGDAHSKNPDSCMDITKASTSEIESDNFHFSGINPESTNTEEAHSLYPGMQHSYFLSSEINSTVGQSTVANMEISENLNLPVEISNPLASSENICFDYDIRAVPSSSRCNENVPHPNLCLNAFPSASSLNQQTVFETEKKILCLICSRDVSKHVEVLDGKYLYGCCKCSYKCHREDCFMMHIDNHPEKPFYCHFCDKFDLESEFHGSIETCNVCNESFRCRTGLEDHYIIHESYHFENCRICADKLAEHSGEQFLPYKCCSCSYRENRIGIIREHLYTHSHLRIFKCDRCGRRFKQKKSLISHSKKTTEKLTE